jgi:hypothetical protein
MTDIRKMGRAELGELNRSAKECLEKATWRWTRIFLRLSQICDTFPPAPQLELHDLDRRGSERFF